MPRKEDNGTSYCYHWAGVLGPADSSVIPIGSTSRCPEQENWLSWWVPCATHSTAGKTNPPCLSSPRISSDTKAMVSGFVGRVRTAVLRLHLGTGTGQELHMDNRGSGKLHLTYKPL